MIFFSLRADFVICSNINKSFLLEKKAHATMQYLGFELKIYHPSCDIAWGRPRTPAPTIAVTLWKAEYHHFAFLLEVIGSHSSILLSLSDFSSIYFANYIINKMNFQLIQTTYIINLYLHLSTRAYDN
jgi:hypothetical protein